MSNVSKVTENNLCISCGICTAVCPKNCIFLYKKSGLYIPRIDTFQCIECGICYKNCPGKGFDYKKYEEISAENIWTGNYKKIYVASSKNCDILSNSVSGGVVTELVFNALKNDYDCAFLVADHKYSDIVCSERIDTIHNLCQTQKSRYLPISQSAAINYIKNNRKSKVIMVGTPCFFHGLLNVIETFNLNRDNYLLIGLFCDRTMTHNVVQYFQSKLKRNEYINELYFRTKEVNGWPGGVKIVGNRGTVLNLSSNIRMDVKDYFQPERCLYCIDKLNRFADISVGDNYTKTNDNGKGSNSTIIRTEKGEKIWFDYKNSFETHESSMQLIVESQHIQDKENNYHFANIKSEQIGWPINILTYTEKQCDNRNDFNQIYKERLRKISIGKCYDNKPIKLDKELLKKRVIGRIIRHLKKIHDILK